MSKKYDYIWEKVIPKGIVVDASTIEGNPGITECRGLDIETGEIVFSEQIGIATNNIGEFLAIAYAVEYINSKKLKYTIYSDSQTAIFWAEKGTCRTKIFMDYPNLTTTGLAQKIEEGEEILRTYKFKIEFWNKRRHGENPADYGRKNNSYYTRKN